MSDSKLKRIFEKAEKYAEDGSDSEGEEIREEIIEVEIPIENKSSIDSVTAEFELYSDGSIMCVMEYYSLKRLHPVSSNCDAKPENIIESKEKFVEVVMELVELDATNVE